MHIVAHRGYSGKYPELSPSAFAQALELPIHGVECDVHLTRDGYLVVNHDSTLDRTSDRTGRIEKMDWADVHKADIGGGEHPLLLDELLEMVAPTGHHLYVETKHPSPFGDRVEEETVARLRQAGLSDDPRIHLISFSHRAIRTMAHLNPSMDRFYLRRDWERHLNRPDVLLSKAWACHSCARKCSRAPSAPTACPRTCGRSTVRMICGGRGRMG